MDKYRTIAMDSEVLPVTDDVDVLVLGGGVAGCAAAIAAGRLGARTLLVDLTNVPGGMSTAGMMSHYTGTAQSRLYTEVINRLSSKNRTEASVLIEPTNMTLTWIELLEGAGVQMLLYTMACEPIVEKEAVKGVILENKSGRSVVLAKVTVDATGDGDIAARAGAAYYLGRESDGMMQPATLMFKIAGVDMERAVFPGSFETKVPTPKGELQALAEALLPHPAGHVLLYKSPVPGVVTVNMTNAIGIDGTNARSITEAEIVCRKQIPAIVDFLREYVPGYENCYVIGAGSMIGIRETRHFKGLYTLTEEDILACRQFDDWVVREAEFNFDVHNLTGGSLDETGMQAGFPKDTRYTIPYRCLIPETVRGLLLAGRNISGTHMAHSNFRAMPICVAIGEGAGVAAALAARDNIDVREVDVTMVQKHL